MIFRDHKGNLIQINRLDFKNDKLYYNKIIEIKNPNLYNITSTNKNFSKYIINKTLN